MSDQIQDPINFDKLASALNSAAQAIILFILDNTRKGISYQGGAFLPYSEKPFTIPEGKFLKDYDVVGLRKKYIEDYAGYTTIGGERWVTVDFGYAHYKKHRWPDQNGIVNLSWRGNRRGGMLSGIVIKNKASRSNPVVTIGFTDRALEDIARYHEILGASKGRKIRKFFGITKEQGNDILELILRAIK